MTERCSLSQRKAKAEAEAEAEAKAILAIHVSPGPKIVKPKAEGKRRRTSSSEVRSLASLRYPFHWKEQSFSDQRRCEARVKKNQQSWTESGAVGKSGEIGVIRVKGWVCVERNKNQIAARVAEKKNRQRPRLSGNDNDSLNAQ